MPLPNTIIATGAQASANRVITRVFNHAAEAAATVDTPTLQAVAHSPFTIAELDPKLVERFTKQYQDRLVWVDEGNCFNRAMFGVHRLGEMTGTGASPLDDTFAGAIAIRPGTHNGEGYTGSFHAKLAVRVAGTDGLQVIDPLPGNQVMQPLSEWAPEDEKLILRPFDGTGLWNGVGFRSNWVGPQFFDFAADQLKHTWSIGESTYGLRTARPSA